VIMSRIGIAKIHSREKLQELRKVLKNDDPSFTIVVGGSLSRGEASTESDIDYFFFGDDDSGVEKAKDFLNSKQDEIFRIVGQSPSPDGAFGKESCETLTALTTDIGGNDDENQKITRRILFLVEGTWLTSDGTFNRYRDLVLRRYVSESIEDHHLCRFLLNDIIRYYRTICVDFEFKTVEKNKKWGLRYIKLRYSRQLLYFSGLIAIAETVGLDREGKIQKLVGLFDMAPVDRIVHVFGDGANVALGLYDNFLTHISDPSTREELNLVTLDKATHTEIFKKLRESGRDFTGAMVKLLTDHYDSNHLIHNAIIF
jgi:hypothetical protein